MSSVLIALINIACLLTRYAPLLLLRVCHACNESIEKPSVLFVRIDIDTMSCRHTIVGRHTHTHIRSLHMWSSAFDAKLIHLGETIYSVKDAVMENRKSHYTPLMCFVFNSCPLGGDTLNRTINLILKFIISWDDVRNVVDCPIPPPLPPPPTNHLHNRIWPMFVAVYAAPLINRVWCCVALNRCVVAICVALGGEEEEESAMCIVVDPTQSFCVPRTSSSFV